MADQNDNIFEYVSQNPDGEGLIYGYQSLQVAKKHIESYSKDGQSSIRDAVQRVYKAANLQYSDPALSNNVLLVGKVQSGKTSNLEELVALSFDNGCNLVVIFGGYDLKLLAQTAERFRDTFDADDNFDLDSRKAPLVFTSDDHDNNSLSGIDSTVLERILSKNVPVIISVLKKPIRLNSVSQLLKEVQPSLIHHPIIIDDEGDQASLNIAKNKEEDVSKTYEAICAMKDALGDPLYYSVTATPQANIFLDRFSRLIPDSVHLLKPGKGYCGAEQYHLLENSFVSPVEDDVEAAIEANRMPASMKDAVVHFLFASILMGRRGIGYSDMLIHSDRLVDTHSKIYKWVVQYLAQMQGLVEDALEDEQAVSRNIIKTSFDRAFLGASPQTIDLDNQTLSSLQETIRDTKVIIQNGADRGTTQGGAQYYSHKIYIGADLLQRGLTFKRLVTTYFTRWAKSGGNMDTNLQRARWFGYRMDYIDLCRWFTTDEISSEFVSLAEMENDLWQQFEEVESGLRELKEVVILAENTRQKPTSKSKASFRLDSTSAPWMRQKFGTFAADEINRNNSAIENFMNELPFNPVCLGWTDADHEQNCRIARIGADGLLALFKSLSGIYDEKAFIQARVERRVKEAKSIAVIDMTPKRPRERSFYSMNSNLSCQVKVLQQGRDASDESLAKYKGDTYVVDKDADLTIQIHRITPKEYKDEGIDFTQYMFAIYSNTELKRAYLKG